MSDILKPADATLKNERIEQVQHVLMTPVIGASVRESIPDQWVLGSSKVCERVTTRKPSGAIITWQDGEDIFCLRELAAEDTLLPNHIMETGLVHEAGTSAAVWSLGSNTFCKVKAWCKELESESDTICFVRNNAPSIPLPEVIYSWVDHDWNRSFMILKRVSGQTLQDAWPQLSSLQKSGIASQIAMYCSILSGITSSSFESATHRGVLEPFLALDAEPNHPSWKPRPLGPFSLTEFVSHLSRRSSTHYFDIGTLFYFYHADLGPGNIMVEDSKVVGILDWESAGFYPRYWIALKPTLSAGFFLKSTDTTEKVAWRNLLGEMIAKEGFELVMFE
ncbi:hypothetical protein HYFRA_00013719 [Hymenoscyphus fraxineus]|uniref:Aminoglycoside phosphotransferase domain-containing protein n=1 Tax=Hymenoscyphus fraxineus TaxID=746836 RepID=A0A9N9PPF9_9HELO|nr:hypothetical protein HYFRA_00013719 [Hymenoscyphus fraxineus]